MEERITRPTTKPEAIKGKVGCPAENQRRTGGVAAHGTDGVATHIPQGHRQGDQEQHAGKGNGKLVGTC